MNEEENKHFCRILQPSRRGVKTHLVYTDKLDTLSDLTKHHSETAVNTCFLSVKNDKIRAFCSHSSRGRSKNIQDSHSTPRAGLRTSVHQKLTIL
ncbi:uncharacterized protein LOC111086406 isoform X1 [Limulus polyphemus]|uniref:Uncharacterized protein LOC111086406 isoform X1 n=1 Tax=Limulus polyphemus TaxID=6850 RepID=A0ABM1SMF1_LIMPO|nr:uncharacterized protein LOC111086406 isoform X1 [Limulus polyphemus]